VASPPTVTIRAPAKVNLLLAVLEKLPDGYHRVETVLQTVSLWDEIILRAADAITLTCDDPSIPADESNLCHRAAALLRERARGRINAPGVSITLRKHIPAQAGLGGGSSDAAGTLIGLNRLWGLRLRRAELSQIGAELGADVPFFIHGGTALATGRGDVLTRLEAAPLLCMVLARRDPGISTRWAYSRCRPKSDAGAYGQMLNALGARSPSAIASALRNDLETAVLPGRPDIAELKQRLVERGALGALMSGSGSAVFGIFAGHRAAQETAAAMSKNGVWARAVRSIRQGASFTTVDSEEVGASAGP
jgi:4-diphosphocytidyl-2-C-methyl-D-erythritol kinase